MSAVPSASADGGVVSPVTPMPRSKQGHWKIGAGIFAVAVLAQAILWTMWWEDPTHFKMSILFVWPAAIFSLLVWWTFFSGWSALVRFGLVGVGLAALVAFFSVFRLERFDGDMTPTRISYRWTTSVDQKARDYLEQLKVTPPAPIKAAAAEPLAETENDWPGYRGADRSGVLSGMKLRTDWVARLPQEVWRHPVGKGWSSFVVIDDFAFTQEQRQDDEAIVAYRFSDGVQVWEHRDKAKFPGVDPQGGTGPRATPQFHDGKLYVLGATGLLNCLEAPTGQRIWTTNILEDAGTPGKPAANLEWGMAGSPLIVDNLVIVIPGGTEGKSVAAYDKETGKKVWASGKHPATYGSPRLATLLGQQIVLVPLGTGLAGHAIATGKELWFFKWTNAPKVCGALPVVLNDDSVLYGIGYGEGTVRLKLSKTGDQWSAEQQWHSNRFRPKFNDFVVRDGHAYGLDDGTLTCIDVESGKMKWKSGRYGYGQILLADELLLIISEKGTVSLLPAQPTKPEELATFSALDEAGITWNQPVLLRGKLLVRNAHEAACYDLE